MDKLKYIKLENEDGSYSDSIPLAVDSDHVDVNGTNLTFALNLKANNSDVAMLQNEVNSLASGSPKGSYANAAAIVSANPSTGVYIAQDNGHIYSWTKDGSSAIDLGVYQATSINDNSIMKEKINTLVKEEYDSINPVVGLFPDEIKETREYVFTLEHIAIDPSDGHTYSSSQRLTTNYIPLGKGVVFTHPNGSIIGAWCRLFDKDFSFLGTAFFNSNGGVTFDNAAICSNPMNLDLISSYNANVKYVRLVFANLSISGNIDSIDWTSTYKEIKTNASISEIVYNYEPITIDLEYGPIRSATGIDNPARLTQYLRSKFYYKVGKNVSLDVSYENKNIIIYQYDENFTFLRTGNSSTVYTPASDVIYVRFGINDIADSEAARLLGVPFKVSGLEKKIKRNYTINENLFDCQRLHFDIKGTNYYSNCLFKLPSNYDPIGKPVPMIVFVHGSADFGDINAARMTSTYNDLYNYLRDNGYAVWDCYGWGNFQNGVCSTTGTPLNINTYCSGIEYFTELFNIDKDNIFMCGKSYGGVQELAMLYQDRVKLKAVGFLAPALSILHHGFGYTKNERNAIVSDLKMSTPPEGLLDTAMTYPPSQAYEDYLNENLDILLSYEPYWKGLLVDKDTKLHNSLYGKDTQNQSSYYRLCQNIPTKFWFAMDDGVVPVRAIINLIDTLKNSGAKSSATILPNGTGQHHSVDTDENAPQVTDVTTSLGIHYDTVPQAYYEFIDFISTL